MKKQLKHKEMIKLAVKKALAEAERPLDERVIEAVRRMGNRQSGEIIEGG